MLRFPHPLRIAGLVAVLAIAGCNVLDAAYEDGGTVDNLIEDAYYARINSDFEQSEDLLREALDLAPEHPVVRMDLASTLMQGEHINLLDLERVTTYLLDEIETEGGQGRGTQSETCTWDSDEPARPFNPAAAEGYEEFVAVAPVLGEVLGLLNDAASPGAVPVLPERLGEIDACTLVESAAVSYNRDALLAPLRDNFDGDDRRISAALTMNAVARTLRAYLGIFESPDVPVHWFLVGEPGDTRVGFCTEEDDLAPFRANVNVNLNALAEAYFSLDLLIYNGGNEEMRAYLDEALDLYTTLEASLGTFCDG